MLAIAAFEASMASGLVRNRGDALSLETSRAGDRVPGSKATEQVRQVRVNDTASGRVAGGG